MTDCPITARQRRTRKYVLRRFLRIEQRCAAAVPNWHEDMLLFMGEDQNGESRGGFHLNYQKPDGEWEYNEAETDANTKFAASARQDVPDLLVAVWILLDYCKDRDEAIAAIYERWDAKEEINR